LYEHGGIYSDFDNIIDYPCLLDLLKPYQSQNRLVFMTDGRHTKKKTQEVTTNLIFAPSPKLPVLKKMLDSLDETK
jgi:mannosyltransferase OCH1-like enzyme